VEGAGGNQGREGDEWKVMGPGGGLGGSGVWESYISGVRTPANLPHFCLQFAKEIAFGRSCRPIQVGV